MHWTRPTAFESQVVGSPPWQSALSPWNAVVVNARLSTSWKAPDLENEVRVGRNHHHGITYGAMALTRMPCVPTSWARDFVRPMMAALLVLYATFHGEPIKADTLDALTREPPGDMCLNSARRQFLVPPTLTSMIRFHSSSDVSVSEVILLSTFLPLPITPAKLAAPT